QVLARVDSPELDNELSRAESSLQQQTVELERQRIESRQLALEKRKAADLAEVALIAAKREKKRADEANVLSVISAIDFAKAQDDLQNAELAHQHAIADADLFDERLAFELRASELAVERQRLLVADLQRQVDALAIRSPVNGIVGDLLVEQKAAVAKDTPVMAVVDLTRFEIDAQIPESYADDLAIGMVAEIMLGSTTYAGKLVAVSPEIVSNQVSSRIRFEGDMPPNLRQNQRLTTRVLLEERPDVLMLQRGQFLESGAGRVAYVLTDDKLAHRRGITIGARSLAAVQIASGLEEGDTVVISSLDAFEGAETVLVTD
ncbi:MAG: efflux RND transporter periplasmic adaptor subunit, partial [Woeseiaceae bacterium]